MDQNCCLPSPVLQTRGLLTCSQSFTADVWWYYTISLSFYWSLITSQMFSFRQKDFWRSLTYNLVAVFILSFSWICNAFRIGTLILLFHDATDAFFYVSDTYQYEWKSCCFFLPYFLHILYRLVKYWDTWNVKELAQHSSYCFLLHGSWQSLFTFRFG